MLFGNWIFLTLMPNIQLVAALCTWEDGDTWYLTANNEHMVLIRFLFLHSRNHTSHIWFAQNFSSFKLKHEKEASQECVLEHFTLSLVINCNPTTEHSAHSHTYLRLTMGAVMRWSLTFRIIAGLGQSLAVRQHCKARHCNSHYTPFFACFILGKKKHEKTKT